MEASRSGARDTVESHWAQWRAIDLLGSIQHDGFRRRPVAPHQRGHSEDVLRSLRRDPLCKNFLLIHSFRIYSCLSQVKVPVGKHCGFVQFVRKPDAERAIEKMQGFPIGGSRIRLSWGRSQCKFNVKLYDYKMLTSTQTRQRRQQHRPPRPPRSRLSINRRQLRARRYRACRVPTRRTPVPLPQSKHFSFLRSLD